MKNQCNPDVRSALRFSLTALALVACVTTASAQSVPPPPVSNVVPVGMDSFYPGTFGAWLAAMLSWSR